MRVSDLIIKEIKEAYSSAIQYCKLAEMENHYRYHELVRLELEKMDNKMEELRDAVLSKGVNEVQTLKRRFQGIIVKYNN